MEDQPLTRRERRERERAAEAASAAGSAPGSGSGQPSQQTPPQAQSPQSQGQQPWEQQPQQSGSSWGSAGQPQPASQAGETARPRPTIRSAARGRAAEHPRTWDGQPGRTFSDLASAQTVAQPAASPPTATSVWAQAESRSRTGADPEATAAMPAQTASAAAARPAAAGGGSGKKGRGRTTRTREPLGPVRATVRGFGELCITAGLILILFVVWQLWWTDIAANRDNEVLADDLITEWRDNPANELPEDPEEPYVAEAADINTAFGIMYIPRFGDDYFRTVAEGVSLEPVLNRMGVGRYPTSAMPGEVGNFAIAGHRVTYGKPLNQIHALEPGDEIIVQTADGFYTYTFRNFDIVLPDETEVLAAVPEMPEIKGKDRIMTMTACNPMFSARERYVAYAELTDWRPAPDGPPASIADSPAYKQNGGA